MNQLACVYFEKPDDFVQKTHSQDFISMFNKYRCVIYFACENPQFERALMAPVAKSDLKLLMLTSVFKVHECLVPSLIRKEPVSDGSLTKDEVALTLKELNDLPPIVEKSHNIWIRDIDMWYNFPESWSEIILPQIPETCFFKFISDV